MKKAFLLFLMLIIACFIIIGCKDSSNNTNNSSNANVGVLRDLSVNLEKNYSVPDSDSNVIELASTPDELFSHSNSFSIEMEKDAAVYRAFNLNYYCRRWYHVNKSNYHCNFYLCDIFDLFSCDSYY